MDVCNENFDLLLEDIQAEIKSSKFIAIDCEYSALFSAALLNETTDKRTYFDSGATIYEKESKNVENASVCQIGISIFKPCMDSNKFEGNTYNIYVRASSLLSIDDPIVCLPSSLSFLSKAHFNFKKWIEDGVPCLNYDQEIEVKQFYSKLLSGETGVYIPYEVLDQLDEVTKWSKNCFIGESMTLHAIDDTCTLMFFSSVLSSGINVLPSLQDNVVSITMTDSFERDRIEGEALKALNAIVDRHKGFVKVFDCIVDAKVPLIFHNGLLDMMLMYKQFHRRLPKNYHTFRERFNSMFPIVYDTKHLAHAVRSKVLFGSEENGITITDGNFLRTTALMEIKKDLEKEMIVLHRPSVIHSSNTPKYSGVQTFAHEAGYDAFCTGYCFLHLSHIYTMHKYGSPINHRPLSPRELIHSMNHFKNQIPVQRAGINFLSLDGLEPALRKYTWLVVESRKPFQTLSPESVEACLSPFGAVDVVRRNRQSVMVTSPRNSVVKDILNTLRNNEQLIVTRYNVFKHSRHVRSIAWSCALVSTGLSTWLIIKSWNALTNKG